MPLPSSDPKATWPPASLNAIRPVLTQWDAWWQGKPELLQAAYGGGTTAPDPSSQAFYQSDTGRFQAAINRTFRRWFVGEPARGNERSNKVVIPIAADLAQASADLLFSDPFTATVTDKATQERLTEVLDEDFHTTIAEGAELCAAHGGVYLVLGWDPKLLDHPFPLVRGADEGVPEFRFGRLIAVTFWSVVGQQGSKVYRHVERHELQNENGVILHGLYEGTADTLGIKISLLANEATAPLAVHVDLNVEGTIDTRSPGLAVVYVPNQTPNRQWRKDPIGRNFGRADIDGVEALIDDLSETYSDMARARRVARARIMHARSLVKSGGPGQGSILNTSQEDYVSVDALGGKDQTKLSDLVQVLQPTFDPTGYLAQAHDLIEQIVQMAGYSPQTFGIDTGTSRSSGSGSKTATEIESREQRTLMTRDRKIREWKPALRRFIEKLLFVDAAMFGGPGNTAGLDLEFSNGVQESQLTLAQTTLALYQSQSASIEERVALMHPDWQEPDIAKEAAKIRKEFAITPMQDPANPLFSVNDDEEPDDGAAAAGAAATDQ
ncbi:phage portal protein [Curtobacterium sp. 22159]|uniref:phage portal protein n=1 Tax=Curtobacterium sp. 22159 TaxID=3453882 RepID=UPI003F845D4A